MSKSSPTAEELLQGQTEENDLRERNHQEKLRLRRERLARLKKKVSISREARSFGSCKGQS